MSANFGNKQTIQIIQKDSVRNLIVPNLQNDKVKCLNWDSFDRILKEADTATFQKNEHLRDISLIKSNREQLQNECEQRKQTLLNNGRNLNLSSCKELHQIQESAKHGVLKKARELQCEQFEEVKKLNKLISQAKNKAFLAAQLQMKKDMEKEKIFEEQKFNEFLHTQKIANEQKEKKERSLRLENRKKNKEDIQRQLKDRQIRKLIEIEQNREEARLINLRVLQIQQEEESKFLAKRQKQEEIRRDIDYANEQANIERLRAEEQTKLFDLRIHEYMRKKREEEDEREKILEEKRKARELELKRLRDQQEKQQDYKAKENELKALKVQEERLYEQLKKEQLELLKKREMNEHIRQERDKQVAFIEQQKAIEKVQEEQSYLNMLQRQFEDNKKDIENILNRKEKALLNQEMILKQIEEKNKSLSEMKREKILEGEKLKIINDNRKKCLKETLDRKLDQLRSDRLPEEYIKEIESKLQVIKLEIE